MSIKISTEKNEVIHDNLSPEKGGFGYIVLIAVTIISITVSLPLAVFGIIFGKFLAKLGDETTGTSLANGIFNTVLSFTGLAANVLLNKWSCRRVGMLGGLFCVIGCFGLVFVRDLISFIAFFGIFQGFGYGLLLPASLTALNNAFDKRLSFMMSLSQALMVTFCMLMPPCASAIMDTWGYRGAVLCLSGITLLNIPAAAVLTQFNRESKKTAYSINNELAFSGNSDVSLKCKSTADLTRGRSKEPLLRKYDSLKDFPGAFQKEVKILHIADRTTSIASIDGDMGCFIDNCVRNEEKKSLLESITSLVDFSLLARPKYLNISIGLSLSFTSDINFITMLPLILTDLGLNNQEIALTMSIFFGSDLVSRILLSIVSSITTIKSRYLVMGGSLFSVIFRVAFVWCRSYMGKITTLAILGFLRCFIQTPLPLVISEEYPNQFATAFSLYMVVCGAITLIFGPLMGFVKAVTESNEMVCHLLTSCYVICVISWLCEIVLSLRQKKKVYRNKSQQEAEYKV